MITDSDINDVFDQFDQFVSAVDQMPLITISNLMHEMVDTSNGIVTHDDVNRIVFNGKIEIRNDVSQKQLVLVADRFFTLLTNVKMKIIHDNNIHPRTDREKILYTLLDSSSLTLK